MSFGPYLLPPTHPGLRCSVVLAPYFLPPTQSGLRCTLLGPYLIPPTHTGLRCTVMLTPYLLPSTRPGLRCTGQPTDNPAKIRPKASSIGTFNQAPAREQPQIRSCC